MKYGNSVLLGSSALVTGKNCVLHDVLFQEFNNLGVLLRNYKKNCVISTISHVKGLVQ